MHCYGCDVTTAFAEFGAGFSKDLSCQVVALVRCGCAGALGDSVVGQCGVEEALDLRDQGGGAKLQDGAGQVAADCSHGVRTRAQGGEIIHCIGETPVHDGHDLLVRSDFLRCQVAFTTCSPGRVGLDYFFGGVDWLEEWNADPDTACAAVESCVTHHHAGLDPRATVEDFFGDVRQEFWACD